jgi:hypothetical protein
MSTTFSSDNVNVAYIGHTIVKLATDQQDSLYWSLISADFLPNFGDSSKPHQVYFPPRTAVVEAQAADPTSSSGGP